MINEKSKVKMWIFTKFVLRNNWNRLNKKICEILINLYQLFFKKRSNKKLKREYIKKFSISSDEVYIVLVFRPIYSFSCGKQKMFPADKLFHHETIFHQFLHFDKLFTSFK